MKRSLWKAKLVIAAVLIYLLAFGILPATGAAVYRGLAGGNPIGQAVAGMLPGSWSERAAQQDAEAEAKAVKKARAASTTTPDAPALTVREMTCTPERLEAVIALDPDAAPAGYEVDLAATVTAAAAEQARLSTIDVPRLADAVDTIGNSHDTFRSDPPALTVSIPLSASGMQGKTCDALALTVAARYVAPTDSARPDSPQTITAWRVADHAQMYSRSRL